MRLWLVAFLFYPIAALAAVSGIVSTGSGPGGGLSPLAVTFQNATGSGTSAGYVTLGQGFKKGDVKITDNLLLRCGGNTYYVQHDDLATYRVADGGDGSVRHAALTVNVPALSAHTSIDCTWERGSATPPVGSPPTASALAASSYAATATFSNFYIPTPTSTVTVTLAGSIPDNTYYTDQLTCVNANGESAPTNGPDVDLTNNFDGNRTFTFTVPSGCGGTATGWNVYINGHQQGTTHSMGTSSVAISSVSGSGAAPPSSNTASLGTSDSAACKSILSSAISGGSVQNWLAGLAVNEFDVKGTIQSGSLTVRCHIRAYADGSTMTDLILDNSRSCPDISCAVTALAFNYDISTTGGFSASTVQQPIFTMWHHQIYQGGALNVESGAPNVKYNYAYLRDAGFLPDYDTSIPPDQAFIDNCGGGCGYNSHTYPAAPMSTNYVTTAMVTQGGRYDLSLLPGWTVQWALASQGVTCMNQSSPDECSWHARVNMMQNADAAGTGVFMYRDESTDAPVSAVTYASDANGPSYGAGNSASCTITFGGSPNALGCYQGSSWAYDIEHVPDLNYVPYLITASHWQLMLLQYWANQQVLGKFNYGICKDRTTSLIHLWNFNGTGSCDEGGTTTRQQAWGVRGIAQAAVLTPDNDASKSYFYTLISNAIAGAYSDYVTGNVESVYGAIYGFTAPGPINQLYQEGYVASMMDLVRRVNLSTTITTQVSALLAQKNNYFAGSVQQGNPDGSIGVFPGLDASAYKAGTCNQSSSYNSGAQTFPCPIGAGGPITTWSLYYSQNVFSPGWVNGQNGMPPEPITPGTAPFTGGSDPMINFICCGPTQSTFAGVGGGYPELLNNGETNIITLNGDPLAIGGWAFTMGRIQYGYAVNGVGWIADTASDPQFAFVPKMPDGTFLTFDQVSVCITGFAGPTGCNSGSSPTLTASGSIRFLDCVDATGTCTLNGGGSQPNMILMNDALNSSYAAGVFNFAAGQNTYAYGGWGVNNTFNTNTGNDYVWLPATGGGSSTVAFDNTPSGADQVANFRHGVTNIRVLHTVDGENFTNDGTGGAGAGQFVSLCAVSGSDTICTLGTNTIRLLGAVSGGVKTITAADVTIH
jgi:hypothetical protein